MPNQPLKTYAAFIVPHPSAPEKGIALPVAVKTRDIAALDVPLRACAFYFYDAPAGIEKPEETLRWQENASKVYLLANTLMSREDVKTLLAGPPAERQENIQWDPRIEANDLFVVTRNQAIQHVTERHVVLNGDRRQIWPAHAPGNDNRLRNNLEDVFNPVLQKDVVVRKPLTLKPRPPRPPGI